MKKLFFLKFLFMLFVSFLLTEFSSLGQSMESSLDKEKTTLWFNSGEWLNGLQLKPHESIDQHEFIKQYYSNRLWWDKAFEFLKTNDLNHLKPGNYIIDTGNVFASVSEEPAKELEKIRWESHRNFNDIQYIINGRVEMGLAPVSLAKITEPYDSKKDLTLYDAEGEYFLAEPGTFFIFSPQDVHRPGIKTEGNGKVKKIIIKVRSGI